jgi:hypothetical protein
MPRLSCVEAILGLVTVTACASSPGQGAPLCENEALLATIGGGFTGKYYEFMYPLGKTVLYVDSECRAWAIFNSWGEARQLSLSSSDASDLTTALAIRDLENAAGSYETRDCFDGQTTRVNYGPAQVSCYCDCEDSDTPTPARRLESRLRSALSDLYNRGDVVEGGLRIAIVQDPDLEERDVFMWQPWPLDQEIRSFLRSTPLDADSGPTIESDEEIELLRSARSAYVEAHGPLGDDELIPIDPGDGEVYGLLMRDELPSAALSLRRAGR